MSGLLDGMRVVDAGIWRPVPHATQMLADLGADVVKIEPPGGDPMRAFPELFADLTAHKRSVELDLKTDGGRQRAYDLVRDADVFTEGWRPGVASRLGVGYDDLRAVNPSIIYCSVSGYGQDGPLRDRPGHDLNYQALAGAIAPRHARDPGPAIPRVPVADLAAATVAAMVVCAAWARRLRTGEGEHIDVAMADVVASWVGPRDSVAVTGLPAPADGSAGYGVYRCADGVYLTLAVIAEDHFWQAVCDALELGVLGELSHLARLRRLAECDAAVRDAIARLPSGDALARLIGAGAPVAPALRPSEAAHHPQFVSREVFVTTPGGTIRTGFPARLAHHPPRA